MYIQILFFIIIYLSGCFTNWFIYKKTHKEAPLDKCDNIFIGLLLLPFVMLNNLIKIFFIMFSWIGTIVYIIDLGYEQYEKQSEKYISNKSNKLKNIIKKLR